MKSLYAEAARLAGKDAKSARRLVEAEHMFPDLVELHLDGGDAISVLAEVLKKNRRVRNATPERRAEG